MRERVGLLSGIVVLTVVVAGCHGSGTFTEIYNNRKDTGQTLELTTDKAPLKSVFGGRLADAPEGRYTLWKGQSVSAGEYTRSENTYVLTLEGNREWKLTVQSDTSVLDEGGDVWQLQTRSHTLR